MFQYDTDAFKQTGIDSFTLENIIHISAVTMQLLGKPTGTPILPLHFRLYFFSNMNCHLHQ